MGYTDWQKKMDQYMADLQAAADAAKAAGTTVNKYTGGAIRKYATGSVVGDGARDSVSAMLTPGEFVIRKASVDKYGEAFFQNINQGSFSMPKYSAGPSLPSSTRASAPQGAASISAPVYNSYSISVTANTNSSADEIAQTVMSKIKSVENSNIRRVNGY